MLFQLDEDFGDAPSSYDQGNAARALVGDLRLGAQDDIIDNAISANSPRNSKSSPKASSNAEGDNDNAFASGGSVN